METQIVKLQKEQNLPLDSSLEVNKFQRDLDEVIQDYRRQQRRIHDLVNSLSFLLRSFKNLNQFLEFVPMVLVRITAASAGGIVIFKKTGQLQFKYSYTERDVAPSLKEVLENVFTAEEPAHNALLGCAYRAEIERQLATKLSDMFVFESFPIVMPEGEERGRLYIVRRETTTSELGIDDRNKLIPSIADQTAMAISHAELSLELRRRERLDREVEIGAEIQERLLPKQCPDIAGIEIAAITRNANRVSGDYYDFIPAQFDILSKEDRQSKKWSIAIGDVMGKGVPAGLLATMARGMLRTEVLNGHSPARILEHLNRVMYADLENSNRFITLFYCEYDPPTRALSYSNAAHNPPLWWQRADDRLVKLEDTQGMLIGLDVESCYTEATVRLASGDAICYYTDGVTDALNAFGERFEEDNLLFAFRNCCHRHTTAQAILDGTIAAIQAFVGDDVDFPTDDLTLLVLKVL
jgi:phosphoserine phosphatase RsbU/P